MIGFFDSGAGGLSVVREAIRLLPDERYIYYSDNAHCPYGEKSREYVTESHYAAPQGTGLRDSHRRLQHRHRRRNKQPSRRIRYALRRYGACRQTGGRTHT